MKKQVLFLLSSFLLLNFISAQSVSDSSNNNVKTGWNVGVLPALGYDSNLGLLYGGIVNLFDYGNGNRYPNYNNNVYMQLSAYTKGSMDAILFYDSYTLLKDKHFTGRFSYNRNRAYPFYGFNGGQTVYNKQFEVKNENDFISQVYYKLDRELIKGDVIIQDKFKTSDFNWMAGLDFAYYNIKAVDINHLNKGKSEEDKLPDTVSLYENYIDWNIIGNNEKDGGFDNSLKFGLVYDTRDRLTNPMKGSWTELISRTVPFFLGNNSNYIRFSLIHRQYFTLVKEKLSFAYRLWYDASFGNIPFYARQYLSASNYFEGMGGANTLRGILMNRVIGQQTGIINAEFRWKAKRFRMINQNFYLGFNAFADAGYIVKPYNLSLASVPAGVKNLYFDDSNNSPVFSAGLGLKLAMNENFVVSAEYAHSFNESFGPGGLYVLIGYLF